jgi:hypothetical protein
MNFRLTTEDSVEDITLTEIEMIIEIGGSIKFTDRHGNSLTVRIQDIIFLTYEAPEDE